MARNSLITAMRRPKLSYFLPAGSSSPADVGFMIRRLSSGQYRLFSRKIDPKTGKRRNLGTFPTRAQAEKHERAVQYFKRAG